VGTPDWCRCAGDVGGKFRAAFVKAVGVRHVPAGTPPGRGDFPVLGNAKAG